MPSKVKHMQIRYLHLQSLVKNRRLILKKIGTSWNLADLLTKYVNAEALQRLRPFLNVLVVEMTSTLHEARCYALDSALRLGGDLEEKDMSSPLFSRTSVSGTRCRDCSTTMYGLGLTTGCY